MQLWSLASLKSAGQASRLESQERVDIVAQIQRQSGDRIPFYSGTWGLQLIR